MLEYLKEKFAFAVGLPVLGFVVNLLIRAYRIRRIRKAYGDGNKGYVFSVSKEEIKEINRENKTVRGGYDADCAVRTRTGIYVGEKYKKSIYYLGIAV